MRAKALSAQARANRPKKPGEFSSTYKGEALFADSQCIHVWCCRTWCTQCRDWLNSAD